MANNSGNSAGVRELLVEVVQQVAGAQSAADEPETRLAIELQQLRTVAQVQAEAVLANTQAVVQNTVVQESGGSGALAKTGRTVLGTLAAGLSPLITGLARLFTGESEPEPTPLVAYVPPLPVNYSGEIRRGWLPSAPEGEEAARAGRLASEWERRSSASPAAQVTVQVQAMDSRSFLDHSDEIARAVREAMLRSHSLNDVVNEL